MGVLLKKLTKEKLAHLLLFLAALSSIIVVISILLFLIKEAVPFFEDPGILELLGNRWMPVSFQKESFGILPLVTGSILVTVIATSLSVPLGICSAVYISEIAGKKEREILKPIIELLAGVPSVVLGFFGLVMVAPMVKDFFGLDVGLTAFTGALLLTFMAIPTIISISEDALRNIPQSYRQASLALGASKVETIWRVTVPSAIPGIIAAVMLGVGRVLGETMVVLMVTGNSPVTTLSPFSSVRTMTATIAAEMGEVSFGSAHYNALFCIGVVLMVFTFVFNMIAQKVLEKQNKQ